MKTLLKTIGIVSTLIGSSFLFQNCSEKESIPEGIVPPTDSVSSKIEIKNFSIEAQIHTSPDSTVTMQGEGFLQSDTVALISETAANNTYALPLASVTKQSADIVMPKNIVSDTYQLWLKRETDSCRLGKTTLIIENAVDLNIPDIAGMTLKGVVYCENKPLPNVVVSDGYNVVQTDEQGRYYIQSDKKSGFVFISVPGNYEVAIKDNNQPVFFYRLAKDDSVEQHDFELTATDNTNHVLLALADMHLANRNNDLSQFKLRFLPDLNTTVEKYRSEGKKVYGLTLGDMTWDQYWYSNRYDLSKYLITIKSVDLPIFNCTGNHDNNPYCADDWQAEQAYKDIIGPTYYSFNLGNAHYIVLDNIQYINTGASQGTIGKRNYNKKLTEEQLSWLKKDLATVTDKNAPLFVAMHAQLYANPTSLPQKNTISMSGGSTLVNYLKEFTNAHVITGHTHSAEKPHNAKKTIAIVLGSLVVVALVVLIIVMALQGGKSGVDSITLDHESAEIAPQDTLTLKATVLDASGQELTDETLTWSSSNAAVATVKDGVVTGVTEGKAKITVKAGKRSADCTITVTNDAIEVKSLKLDKDRAEMQIGDSLTLTATMQPANAPDDLVSWASSDPNIATVKKGIVVATSSGSVTITASAGSCTATCQITVQAPSRVDSVTAETASATLDLGGTKTGTITFHIHGQNLDSLQSTVKVYAADGSVVSLGQPVRTGNGTDDTYSVTATAAAAGSTSVILQITGADGTTHSAACTVTVKESKTILDLIPGVNG